MPKIIHSFEALPGIRTFESGVRVGEPEIGARLYFAPGSIEIGPEGRSRLSSLRDILERALSSQLLITGHTDRIGGDGANRLVAIGRAKAARAVLLGFGVPAGRMSVNGSGEPPPGTLSKGADSLGRCVRFTLVKARPRGSE